MVWGRLLIKSYVQEDPRPRPRTRDRELLRSLHLEWRECALCGATSPLSIHHISKHPRDDERANLVMLCGHGTTGCHGLIEAWDHSTVTALGKYILHSRGDTIAYLYERLGAIAAQEFFKNNLLLDYGMESGH